MGIFMVLKPGEARFRKTFYYLICVYRFKIEHYIAIGSTYRSQQIANISSVQVFNIKLLTFAIHLCGGVPRKGRFF